MIDPMTGPDDTARPKPWIPLSVVCIAHQNDAKWISKMIASLPPGCECVVLWNKHGEDPEVKHRKEQWLENGIIIRFYDTEWEEFSFSELRNKSIDLAEREWVLWLDADDRLLTHQHEFFLRLDEYPPGLGGLMCGCVGVQPTHSDAQPNEVLRYHTESLRLFRRGYGFQFEGRAHEQIVWSIQEQGYQTAPCSLLIHHEGYEVDADAMRAKMERNVRLISAELSECTHPDKLRFWAGITNRDTQSLMFYLTK